IVIVWGTFQSAAVNVNDEVETVPSAGLLLLTPIVTAPVGWLVSTTVKLALPPASVVTSPAVGVTTIPAVSSSRFVTATSAGFTPLYWASALAAGLSSTA